MYKELKPVRIFISSPGDVAEERALTRKIIERLQGEFSGRIQLDPVFWEHEPLRATQTFQEQITRPSETDIVITILWSRLVVSIRELIKTFILIDSSLISISFN